MKTLRNFFPTVLTTDECSSYDREVEQYHCSTIPVFDDIGLDVWWNGLSAKYPTMSKVIKACLSIFTGPRVEQSFSYMNDVRDPSSDRMSISTFQAILSTNAVKMYHRKDIVFDEVDKSLVHHIQTARRREIMSKKSNQTNFSWQHRQDSLPCILGQQYFNTLLCQ